MSRHIPEGDNTTRPPVVLTGVSASAGVVDGCAFVFARRPVAAVERRCTDTAEAELERLVFAIDRAIDELQHLQNRSRGEIGTDGVHIFRVQQTMLEDETLVGEIRQRISAESICADTAVQQVFSSYIEMFAALDEESVDRERKGDLEDLLFRISRILAGGEEHALSRIPPDSIIVASELYPSDTIALQRENVAAIVTERGGITSHVAILARNLGIPAAIAVRDATRLIHTGDDLYVDTDTTATASVHVRPSPEQRKRLDHRKEQFRLRRFAYTRERNFLGVTTDGRRVSVAANVSSVDELARARDNGAPSVGLFRSEFLFVDSAGQMDEERQFTAYRRAVETFPEGYVVLRTLDAGADKPVPGITIPGEKNPFLGYRGVRISLARSELLQTQLRAALRASSYGHVKILFPMISGPNEMRRVLSVAKKVEDDLRREGYSVGTDVEWGAMIEVPSAVYMVHELAELVDFLSIGTNDLTQYLLAADRMNDHVEEYYQLFHPAVFRAVGQVIEAAHFHNRWVGVCGELGGMAAAIPVLVGLGVDELSMNFQSIAEAIYVIRRTSYRDARMLAEEVRSADSEETVKDILARRLPLKGEV